VAHDETTRQGRVAATSASGVIAAIAGIAPHVLHHVGFLAGIGFVSGATGTALFAVLGFALAIPLLVRLHRRFGTWLAPAIALAVMAAAFAFSALVIGPAISGE